MTISDGLRKGEMQFIIKSEKIAKEYDVQLADMTDGEYEKYYFEDESHLALKGLVTFNEKIYDFYKTTFEIAKKAMFIGKIFLFLWYIYGVVAIFHSVKGFGSTNIYI